MPFEFVFVPKNRYMSESAEHCLQALLNTWAELLNGVQTDVHGIMVPVDKENPGGCAVSFLGDNTEEGYALRAGQVFTAARYVRNRWHPTEVLWICDAYVRGDPDADPTVPPEEDPNCTEALVLVYGTRELGPQTMHASLPYGRGDDGRVHFEMPEEGWEVPPQTLMDNAIVFAISPKIPPHIPETVAETELRACRLQTFDRTYLN